MPAQLLALDEGPSILLDKPILLLGRHPECDIQIDSRKISRRHCCIAQVNNYLVVRDLGSTNGVRINGVRVQEGRLIPGDELIIGTSRYQVLWDSLKGNGAHGKPAQLKSNPPPAPVEDDLLESSDEPVPLPEPEGAPSVNRPHFNRSAPVPMEDALEHAQGNSLLPEEFNLLPISHVGPPSPVEPPAEPNAPL